MRLGSMTSEIDAGGERNSGGLKRLEREALAVESEGRAIGVDEEAAARHHGDVESELAQRRNEKIAARLEFAAATFHDLEGLRREARQRRALRRRGRRDVQVLRELLDVAHVSRGRDQPAEPPAG